MALQSHGMRTMYVYFIIFFIATDAPRYAELRLLRVGGVTGISCNYFKIQLYFLRTAWNGPTG